MRLAVSAPESGTPCPSSALRAPELKAHETAAALNSYHLPGVRFWPITYQPYYFSYKGQDIAGAQIYFTDPAHAPLTAINFYALEVLRKLADRDLFAEGAKTIKLSPCSIRSMELMPAEKLSYPERPPRRSWHRGNRVKRHFVKLAKSTFSTKSPA